ncbi:hypothetical protein PtrV1_05004 [Pyrenophora tritici-repentis]|uniref:Uncharacterized protein n=1 Tax=Pyrenophora tritici-repentis TaxID=45151 RepID=A0A2W1GQ08_9PLEO|nr:hypothetical protein PtrV1_05004 [Pyrenophora tritici-repentis]KAF7452677.1 hypothetical protein A1F99_044550 [Pyrenophora tritici-repentis]KAF7574145.1 hypothetical protein PtrM4_057680 [Pyrenophora tritici-repentis]KAI1561706.1 hypothetical protein PtrEW4_010433 [Pyrenophora tritici-repentis]KAI1564454.1 hypothetical protein PtrEW7m1_010218 [Pyrenophora tritici-repentis]
MKTSPGTNSGLNRLDMAVKAQHEVAPAAATMPASQLQYRHASIVTDGIDSPTNGLEQDTEGFQGVYGHSSSPLPTRPNGMIQPSDSPGACEGRAHERGGVDAHTQVASKSVHRHVKRPNDGESPERKRVCLQSGKPDTNGVNEIASTEHAIFTSVSRPDQEPYMPTSSDQFASVGTSAPMEPLSTIHKLILNREDPESSDLSTNFVYWGQSDVCGTSDCCLEYSWTGFSAVKLLRDRTRLSGAADKGYYTGLLQVRAES